MGIIVTEKIFAADDFTALSEHQEQTPSTFFGATPVLHLHCPRSTLRVSKEALSAESAFASLSSETDPDANTEIAGIDVWVTSKFIALCSTATHRSVQIDYPTISVHGQQDDAVLLVLSLAPQDDMSNEDHDFVQFHIVPTSASTGSEAADTATTNGHTQQSYAAKLFKAIGDCQELNPGPDMDEDEDEAPSLGAGGWITSENMNDFMDEDGNFQMPAQNGEDPSHTEPLGPGAGRTRTAADAVSGDDADADDATKWQRTD